MPQQRKLSWRWAFIGLAAGILAGGVLAFLDARGLFTQWHPLESPDLPPSAIAYASPDILCVFVADGSTRCIDRSPLADPAWLKATPPPTDVEPPWLGGFWWPSPPKEAIDSRKAGWPGRTVQYAITSTGTVYEWRPLQGGAWPAWLCGIPAMSFVVAPLIHYTLSSKRTRGGSPTTR